jgi:2-polyprenyl-3-methyl-5-hydroxy-6-metoxy-1,4-benzoquinol methylase
MEDIDLRAAAFDGILLLNVIEHLDDPASVLQKVATMLAPEGVLLMRHPNSDLFFSVPYKWIVEWPKYLLHRWLSWRGRKTRFTLVGFQNQHLFYFNRASVTRMLSDAGMEVRHFSTVDPYNRERMRRSIGEGRLLEALVAATRHVLGHLGLGPECLIVAGRKRS